MHTAAAENNGRADRVAAPERAPSSRPGRPGGQGDAAGESSSLSGRPRATPPWPSTRTARRPLGKRDRPPRSPPDPPPRQRELGRGAQFGQVHAEPFPQAGLARLGHGDDAADLPAGDPAALAQAFVVLTAIIGLLPAGYAVSLRRAVRRPECDIGGRLPAEDRNSVSRKGNMPVRSEN